MTDTGYNQGSAENDDAPSADPAGYNPGAAEDPTTSPQYVEAPSAFPPDGYVEVTEAPADSSLPPE